MRIEPAHVYVIPSNCSLRLEHGLLKLLPRAKGQRHLPIDLFFESLARERKDQAIGVVLSGIASDGTNGVLAIKAAGGFTFAQDPTTAQYDGMPRSAIASGAVDTVGTPTQIAKEISGILQGSAVHPDSPRMAQPIPAQLTPDRALRKVFTLPFSMTS
jgi:two-component system CheB/CheR fusion protein